MRQGTCCQCGPTTSIRSFYSLNGKTYCEPCVWKAAREAKEAGQSCEYVAFENHSICGRCGAYSGDSKADRGDREQEKNFGEYAERIRYRLDSRQIITKQEHDRRFRSGQVQNK
jgi:hypothetical protein